jgi:hypothetical protein
MKKLMLMPLLVGVVWVCSASPNTKFLLSNSDFNTEASISKDLLTKIFNDAAPKFASEYGIYVTATELQIGYDEGTVGVEEIAGGGAWRIIFGGSIVISELEDFT